jgi:hypothetical protein
MNLPPPPPTDVLWLSDFFCFLKRMNIEYLFLKCLTTFVNLKNTTSESFVYP